MELEKIYIARDAPQAHLLVQILEEQGIRAVIMGEALAGGRGDLPLTAETLPSVWVAEGDAARARTIVLEMDERSARMHGPASTWVCSTCGEAIEEQFAICWNCQSSRGAPKRSPAAALPAQPAHPSCVKCGYDLHTLHPGQRCPECGLPVLRSLLNAAVNGSEEEDPTLRQSTLTWFLPIAQRLGCSADALQFVASAWTLAWERVNHGWHATAEPQWKQVSVRDLCEAVRVYAIQHFGGEIEAKAVLTGWRLLSGAELATMVRALHDAGIIEDFAVSKGEEFDDPLGTADRIRARRPRWLVAVVIAVILLMLLFFVWTAEPLFVSW